MRLHSLLALAALVLLSHTWSVGQEPNLDLSIANVYGPDRTLQAGPGMVRSVAFSTDGKTLSSKAKGRNVKLWDTATAKEVPLSRPIASCETALDLAQALAYSPDGNRLAASVRSTVTLWDVDKDELVATLIGGTEATAIAFSTSGKLLATAHIDRTLKLWDLTTQAMTATMQMEALISAVAFSPDDATLAAGNRDGLIQLCDVANWRATIRLEGQGFAIQSLTFRPDGKVLASGSYAGTKLWDLKTGRDVVTLLVREKEVAALAFSRDGKRLALGCDGRIDFWDVSTWSQPAFDEPRTLIARAGWAAAVAFSPDGKTLASAHQVGIRLWDLATGKVTAKLQGHTWPVSGVAFLRDGKSLASASGDEKGVLLWDVASTAQTNALKGSADSANRLTTTPDGKRMAAGILDQASCKEVVIWDMTSGEKIAVLPGQSGYFNCLAISADGKLVAGGWWSTGTSTIKLWSVDDQKLLANLAREGSPIQCLAFSPDGRQFASGAYGGVQLWDVTSREPLAVLDTGDALCVAFSPDGTTLASGGFSSHVQLWNLATRQKTVTYQGHLQQVLSVAFSPDGQTLASGSYDGSIKLWGIGRSAKIEPHAQPIAKTLQTVQQTTENKSRAADMRPTGWATLRGTFKLNGTAPPRRPLVVDRDRNVCASDDNPLLSEDLVVEPDSKGIKDIVIFLTTLEKYPVGDPKWEHPDYLAEADATREFEIKNCIFTSHAFVMRTTQKLKIVNRDPIAHFVRLTADNNGRVLTNLVLPANASEFYQPTSEDSEPSLVSNSIHPWMSAHIVVRDNPYFAVTKGNGSFEIRNLPAGVPLFFAVWHERTSFLHKATVGGRVEQWNNGRLIRTLKPNDTLTLDLVIDPSSLVRPASTSPRSLPPPAIAQKSAPAPVNDPPPRRLTPAEIAQLQADKLRAEMAEYNRLLAEAERSGGKIDPVFAELVKSAPSLAPIISAARRSQGANNLRLLAIALHSHYKPLSQPTAFRLSRDGKPLLSWRVGLLPHLDQQALYDQFHLDEPWDSDHNKTLIAKMPAVFRAPASRAAPGMTTYLGVGGPHGVLAAPRGRSRLETWDNDVPVRASPVPDGVSNTVAIVEASDALAVVWTKPEEWVPSENDPIQGLVTPQSPGFLAVFVDGHIGYFYKQTPPETLRRVFSRDDGQQIEGWDLEDLIRATAPRPGSVGPPSSPKNLQQLMYAMHMFHDRNNNFPPAFITTRDGKPLLSWRVGLLPFLDEKSLYAEFRLNEPWDSDHNKTLIPRMPKVFESPGNKAAEGTTRFLGVGGKWGATTRPAVGLADIIDGSANQLAVVEASEQAAVVWTKPEEWVPDEKDPFEGLLGPQAEAFLAALANGQIVRIPKSHSPEMLRRMFMRNDRQQTDVPPVVAVP